MASRVVIVAVAVAIAGLAEPARAQGGAQGPRTLGSTQRTLAPTKPPASRLVVRPRANNGGLGGSRTGGNATTSTQTRTQTRTVSRSTPNAFKPFVGRGGRQQNGALSLRVTRTSARVQFRAPARDIEPVLLLRISNWQTW